MVNDLIDRCYYSWAGLAIHDFTTLPQSPQSFLAIMSRDGHILASTITQLSLWCLQAKKISYKKPISPTELLKILCLFLMLTCTQVTELLTK